MPKHEFEIRLQALRRLVESLHGPTGRGGIAKLSRQAGINASYISRMLYNEDKDGKRNMGEDMAHKISSVFPNWLKSESDASNAQESAYAIREEALAAYVPEKVIMIPARTDEITEQIVRMLAETDDVGRAMCLAAVKVALSDYVPCAKKQQKS